MEETLIVIMLKDEKTGFFESELGAFSLEEYEQYLVNIYGVEKEKNITLYMTVSIDKDIQDWEFNAIFDYYDIENIKNLSNVLKVDEVEDCYNPTWMIKLKYNDNIQIMREELLEILKLHKEEIEDVFEVITGTPQDIASKIGIPKLSRSDGYKKTEHIL